ncbi:MAG: hypothetical protein HY314_12430 [Acidobacteria bacterium]|nr:hypothetical protein [Acidobacteriota bacterium]
MKKLLALSSLGSSVAFWAITMAAPKILLIILVLVLNGLDPAGGGVVDFTTGSGSLAGVIVNFAAGFFTAGGVTNTELIVGL